MNRYTIEVSITGRASVDVEAENEEEAKAALWAGKGTDGPCEWEYDEIKSVKLDEEDV